MDKGVDRDKDQRPAELAGVIYLVDGYRGARLGALRDEREGEESVSVTFTPSVDGDVYVAWEWGVPRQVDLALATGADVNQAQASLTAALAPTITLAQVVGVSGSLSTTFGPPDPAREPASST